MWKSVTLTECSRIHQAGEMYRAESKAMNDNYDKEEKI